MSFSSFLRKILSEVDPRGYVPFLSKQTFHFHVRSAIFEGCAFGIMSLAQLVARKTLHATEWQLSILTSAPVIGFLFTIYFGHLASSHRKMPIVLYPRMVGVVALMMLAFCASSWWFTILVASAYILWSIGLPAQVGIFALNYPNECRARAYSVAQTMKFIGMLVASYGASKILNYNDATYHGLFLLAGGLGLLSLSIFGRIRVRRETFAEDKKPLEILKSSIQVLTRDRLFASYMAVFFLFGFANLMIMPLRVLTLNDRLGASYMSGGLAITVIPQGLALLTLLMWGAFVDRHSPMMSRGILNLIWALYPLAYWGAEHWGMIQLTYVGALAMGFASSGAMLVWTLGAIYFAPREQIPVYTAVHATLAGVRSATAPFVGIWLAARIGRGNVYLITSAIMVVSAVLMFVLAVRNRDHGAAQAGT